MRTEKELTDIVYYLESQQGGVKSTIPALTAVSNNVMTAVTVLSSIFIMDGIRDAIVTSSTGGTVSSGGTPTLHVSPNLTSL